ncbi:hypothetical protein LLE49_01890 [Alicyclobacillus tolerans]|uniref:hypothetical protein n=1 Tax=Alicyclobacillus tolerans TaxID=90970 RepID=UPI001F1919C3|nr:hypothetical protein [Alicyclobacillus tolerans]MCF8563494.1 hypothetical protein [Alicyclobacillus tolerans]
MKTSVGGMQAVIAFWFMLSLLTIVTTFGLGVTFNMLFKRWWLSMVLYLLLAVFVLIRTTLSMNLPEWILFFVGMVGAVLAAFGTLALKKRGYPLFS